MSDTMRDDNELTPERLEIPDVCCVRYCDKPATVALLDPGGAMALEPATTLLIYAFCPDHAETEVPGG